MKVSDRVKHGVIIATLVSVAAGVAWHFLGRPDLGEVKNDFSGMWADLWNEGPELSDNTTYYWRSGGKGGLTLDLLNLLDANWQGEFENAVREWESGDPDVLTLTAEKGNPNAACTMSMGLMKVCNENYGATGWLGVNEILISGAQGDTIEASLAKMNDYYLSRADRAERAYTMCHELGHGFGLPHTDENFNNRDLFDCMDYTNRPENNLLPGRANFLRLAEMYGVPGAQPRSTHGDNRSLRVRSSPMVRETKDITPELIEEYDRAMAELKEHLQMKSQEEYENNSGWRLLREHSHGGEYARRLNEEYTLKVQMLYAAPN